MCAYCEADEADAALSAGNAEADSAVPDEPQSPYIVFSDEAQIKRVKLIRYPFLDTMTVGLRWGFPYSDRFFDIPSSEFSITTAQGSLGLALSAFRSTAGTVEPQYETYLKGAGFTDLRSFGYDQPTTENSLSGIIGQKKIDDFTLIAVVTCGQGYQNEWAGNLRVGKGERHEGFSTAADLLESYLEQYIADYQIEGSRKLWVTGISRAGAVGNLVAADAIESGMYDDVYAYLFGVPRTTKNPIAYQGIYNICGQYDPVAAVPLQSWGYERYGTDLYTPAQEADAEFKAFAAGVDDGTSRLDSKNFRNNPELNYQLRLIMEFIGTVFEDNEEYADRFQDIMINAMNHHSNKAEILTILSEAFNQLQPESGPEKARISIFVNYLSFMAGQHLRADQRQIRDGSWDPDEPLAANIVLEHRPATYVKWLFASGDPEKMLTCSSVSRRFVVVGNVSVEVKNRSGRSMGGKRGVFMMRNGKETVVSLPDDGEYTLTVTAHGSEMISYYELPVTPDSLLPCNVRIMTGQLTDGSISMDSLLGTELTEPAELSGNYTPFGQTEYRYDPSVIMNEELNATRHSYLSISGAINFLFKSITVLNLMLFFCFVMFLVHRHKVKKGHPPYSDLYVIIPHLILIAAFTFMTVYTYVMLYHIPKVRSSFAVCAVIIVFLLTMRGVIRSRERRDFMIAAVMLVLAYPSGLYFSRISLNAFSWVKAGAFIVIILIMSTAAVWTFHESASAPAAKER